MIVFLAFYIFFLKYTTQQPTEKQHNIRRGFDFNRQQMIEQATVTNNTSILQNTLSYLAICVIAKDEEDIVDWVKYHTFIGFRKIYVYDHGSTQPMINMLLPFIREGIVYYTYFEHDWQADDFGFGDYELFPFGTYNSAQVWAYTTCLRQFKSRHQFIALIDVDEYIVIRDNEQSEVKTDAVEFFKKFEDYASVQLHWRMFGSSGHVQRPQLSPLEAYTQCGADLQSHPKHDQVKAIQNTNYFKRMCYTHQCNTQDSIKVDSLYRHWQGPGKPGPTWNGAFIHHYRIKSEEQWNDKMNRGDVVYRYSKKSFSQFTDLNKLLTGNCSYMKSIARQCCS
eukprot:TRINITY_DN22206_c0_g2_i1.p1 TRINITY_DN22206_c0_g2~~TRINITY_DN22206_c0_g2_i1.p1  ORF type:complete len:337 (-),score=1.90 TRINITY_DN22206_c0_g2_i1:113-1123(-)